MRERSINEWLAIWIGVIVALGLFIAGIFLFGFSNTVAVQESEDDAVTAIYEEGSEVVESPELSAGR